MSARDSHAANRQELPWNDKTAPNRVRPRECVGNARDALDRAYARTDRAAVPCLIEAVDWLRRGLEQMESGVAAAVVNAYDEGYEDGKKAAK